VQGPTILGNNIKTSNIFSEGVNVSNSLNETTANRIFKNRVPSASMKGVPQIP
jgi:hypothetical protein